MKIKTEYLILCAVIIALSAYLYLHRGGQSNYELPVIDSFEKGVVTKIELKKGERKITLTREGEQWRLPPAGHLAESNAVDRMISTLSQLTLTALVSESANYASYELDSGRALDVSVFNLDGPLLQLAIGKSPAGLRHTFVRLADDPNVYHASGDFRFDFDKGHDDLRDKKVLQGDKDKVGNISFQGAAGNFDFVRTQIDAKPESEKKDPPADAAYTWKKSDGQSLTEAVAQQLDAAAGVLADLSCTKFLADQKVPTPSEKTYEVVMDDGQPHRLTLIRQEENRWVATTAKTDEYFELSSWDAERILKPYETLTTPPKTEDPTNASE